MTTGVALGELMPSKKSSLDPRRTPDQEFELYSIPSYDDGKPEFMEGADIGSTKQIVCRGDVLLSKIVPHIRRAWVVDPISDRATIGSSEWIIFRSERFDSAYLRHALLSDRFHQSFMQTVAGVGGSLLRARPAYVADIEIPLPPIGEQRRIAAALDAADALRTKRREALAKLDTLTQAIFIDMFGDPVSNERSWERVKLGTVLDRIDSGRSPVCESRPAEVNEWGVLKLGAVTYGEFDQTQNKALVDMASVDPRKEVKQGDVLFTRKNTYDLVGATAFVYQTRPKLLLSDLIFRLEVNAASRFNSLFLQAQLMHPHQRRIVQQLAGGSAGSMPNISKTRLQHIEVCQPPIVLQELFAERARNVRQALIHVDSAASSFDTLFSSLQQRAFRGKL